MSCKHKYVLFLSDNRLDMFSVHGSEAGLNPLLDPNKETCYTFDGEFGDGESRTFECNSPMNARYYVFFFVLSK